MVAAVTIGCSSIVMERSSADDYYYTPGDVAYNQGRELCASGRHREAIPLLTKAIQLYRGSNDGRLRGDAYFLRGAAWTGLEEFDTAIEDLNEAIRLNSNSLGSVYKLRGMIWEAKKDYDRAIADYERATTIPPQAYKLAQDAGKIDTHREEAYNALAWIHATHADPKYRDGKKAFEYASKAHQLSGGTDAAIMDTLAAAYAECGDFEAAKTWQKKAMKLVGPSLVEDLRHRLELYEERKPYRKEQ